MFVYVHIPVCVPVEDGRLLRIVLQKQVRRAGNTWRSLLDNAFAADPALFDDMEKKMTLERFQTEVVSWCCSGACAFVASKPTNRAHIFLVTEPRV
jgi:hypothetical protein